MAVRLWSPGGEATNRESGRRSDEPRVRAEARRCLVRFCCQRAPSEQRGRASESPAEKEAEGGRRRPGLGMPTKTAQANGSCCRCSCCCCYCSLPHSSLNFVFAPPPPLPSCNHKGVVRVFMGGVSFLHLGNLAHKDPFVHSTGSGTRVGTFHGGGGGVPGVKELRIMTRWTRSLRARCSESRSLGTKGGEEEEEVWESRFFRE
ncbi:hypothetical protein LY76DRAFT_200853 [Colletotrichum caudatum]|nr:hypothetical protein LY76DRAFT_200853 [Colletotrichum caudatum]